MTDTQRATWQSACVFCGSSPGRGTLYERVAQDLGASLGARGKTLVYGGASVGSMGAVADATINAGGKVVGIIPRSLQDKELAHPNLTELLVVDSMAERKDVMDQRSDAFITLPGGMGTLDEIFEMLTAAQLGYHSKPCAFLNVEGYYDHLFAFLDHAVREEFISQAHRELLIIEPSVPEMLAALDAYVPASVEKFQKG